MFVICFVTYLENMAIFGWREGRGIGVLRDKVNIARRDWWYRGRGCVVVYCGVFFIWLYV